MAKNTVILKKNSTVRMERVAGGTITPGHLVKLNSSNQFVVHATAGGTAAKIFAVEDELQGKLITDTYLATARVQADVVQPGDEVYAILTTSQTVIIGDYLESAGDGTLAKAQAQASVSDGESYPNRIIAMALEAVTTTSAVSRIIVQIL
jgi:hypothetical protein